MDQATLNRLRLQDRADLARLLAALNGASNAVKRDECRPAAAVSISARLQGGFQPEDAPEPAPAMEGPIP